MQSAAGTVGTRPRPCGRQHAVVFRCRCNNWCGSCRPRLLKRAPESEWAAVESSKHLRVYTSPMAAGRWSPAARRGGSIICTVRTGAHTACTHKQRPRATLGATQGGAEQRSRRCGKATLSLTTIECRLCAEEHGVTACRVLPDKLQHLRVSAGLAANPAHINIE
jgi:hypothetical protein